MLNSRTKYAGMAGNMLAQDCLQYLDQRLLYVESIKGTVLIFLITEQVSSCRSTVQKINIPVDLTN